MYFDIWTWVTAGIVLLISALLIVSSDERAAEKIRGLFRHCSRRPYRPLDD